MTTANALACLGVSAEQEDLYRFLLRRPDVSVDTLAKEMALAPAAVERDFLSLCDLGLLHPAEAGPPVVVDPAVAVERLMERRRRELTQDLRTVAAARGAIAGLEAERPPAQPSALPPDIERIEGLARIRERLDELAFFTFREVLALQPDGPLSADYIASARALDVRCLGRGIVMRTVVLREAVHDPLTASYLRELAALGARVRVIDEAMERLIIYDGKLAVVPMDPHNSARGALLIRQAGLVNNTINLFEKVWSEAEDLVFDPDDTGADADGLSEQERQVLDTMTRVDKDESGARELGMSVRTYRRYVAELMVRLNASNRFQAALQARNRGWV